MTYTYNSQKGLTTIVDLEENEIKIKTIKNNNEEVDVYEYNEIKTIHLSVLETNWYGISIVFNDGFKVHLKSVTFEKSKYLGSKIIPQQEEYLNWVLLLHKKMIEKQLENTVKFTMGSKLLFITLLALMVFIVLVIIPDAIKQGWIAIFFTVIIPASLSLVLYMNKLGFIKKYNPEELPEKYLP